MENFVLENPTKILFGKDTIPSIGKETIQFGNSLLLVYGKNSIKTNGVYDQVVNSLNQAGFLKVIEHGGVKSNPVLSHVQSGIDLVKHHNLDVILAVGGGSVIDSSKAISAGSLVEHGVWKFFKGKKGIKSALPLTTVLTLPASASEMNGGMVITNEVSGNKLGTGNKILCPKVSILDPTVTFSIPDDYTAYGAIDAIAHMLEFYFTCKSSHTPVQDRFIEGLIINIMDSCEQVLKNSNDYNARSNLMWCATMALNGWTAAGLGIVGFPMHMIEHSLSAIYDVPHGAGLSVVIPAWLKWSSRLNSAKISQFAERIFQIKSGGEEEKAQKGISLLQEWFRKVGGPVNLSMLGVSGSDIPKIAENSLVQAKLWRLREYDQKVIEEILELAR